MEIIKKKISLEKLKSGINGLLPFVDGNGENYGKFVKDANGITIAGWSGNVDNDIRYNEMIRRYHIVMDILRKSLHLKHLENVACNETGKYSNKFYADFTYNKTTNDFIFKENIGVFHESAFTISNNYYVCNEGNNNYAYVILISENDWETYEKYYGISFVKEVNNIIYTNDNRFNKTPYFTIPILFTSNHSDIGIMSVYDDWETFTANNSIEKLNHMESSGLSQMGYYNFETDEQNLGMPYFNSKLKSLRVTEYFTDDEGNLLPGIFQSFDEDSEDYKGKYFKCTYRTGETREVYVREDEDSEWEFSEETELNTNGIVISLNLISDIEEETETTLTTTRKYSWWEAEETNGANLKCADEESVNVGENKYRTLTIFETLEQTLLSIDESIVFNYGDYYYFLVKYDNSVEKPMKIPYKKNIVYNKNTQDNVYTGDYIKSIVYYEDTIKFVYVLGAIFDENYQNPTGGVVYEETYLYNTGVEGTVDIDGFTNIKYWYNNIDFESRKTDIYNSDFNMAHSENIAKIQQIPLGDVWRMDGSVLNTKVFKEEYLMGISFDSNVDIDVEINRGNAAAFERHFRLSECNSMQDLEEISNGFYFE